MARLFLFGGALFLAMAQAAPARAEPAFPAGPLKIINAFPPGGPSDIISRLVAEKMSAALRQPVIVENKPGAGGDVAADQVAKAPADGTTILTGIDTTFTVNPSIYRSMPFKPDDLKPLMIMASSGLMVAINPSLGVKTLAGWSPRARRRRSASARAAMAARVTSRQRSSATPPASRCCTSPTRAIRPQSWPC
jgi:tripartite-type tricarboxylate transporter receptor subunit TctC